MPGLGGRGFLRNAGDLHDFRKALKGLQHRGDHGFAPAPRECDLCARRNVLAAKHQHAVFEKGAAQRVAGAGVERLVEIDSRHRGADRSRERVYLQCHATSAGVARAVPAPEEA